MIVLRLLFLIIVFTGLGLGILFFPNLKMMGHSAYLVYQGDQAYKSQRYPQAESTYRQALPNYPLKAQLLNKIGQANQKMGRQDEAAAFFYQAKEADAKNPDALMHLADITWAQGNRNESLEHLSQLLKLRPNDPAVQAELKQRYMQLVQSAGNTKEMREAAATLKQLIQRAGKGESDTERFELAESLYKQRAYGDALDAYCDLAIDYPHSPATIYSLAVTLAQNHDYDSAYTYMMKATELAEVHQPEYAAPWAQQALHYKRTRQTNLKQNPSSRVKPCLKRLTEAEAKEASKN